MYLARVIGRLVATTSYTGLAGVPYQWIQPLDEDGAAMGMPLVATAAVASGPGDVVHFVDGREGALALRETFVPVDASIIGIVEQVTSVGDDIVRRSELVRGAGDGPGDQGAPDTSSGGAA